MITYLVTSLVGFPLGIIVDRIGYKRYLTMVGMALFMTAHVIIYVFPQCVESEIFSAWSGASSGLFLLGFAYCFYANCIIPSIPIVVSKKITGSAFGIMLVV
jgi:MFS family permease